MNGYLCRTCGDRHAELPMCLGPDAPALWDSLPAEERDTRALLSSDQCIIDGEHFFVRGSIVIPVNDGVEPFIWLVWVSISADNFAKTSELWETQGREAEPSYFGWLQSALPYGESTLNLRTSVQTMPLGQRPQIAVEPGEHQLSIEQCRGITMARVQEIAENAMHGDR